MRNSVLGGGPGVLARRNHDPFPRLVLRAANSALLAAHRCRVERDLELEVVGRDSRCPAIHRALTAAFRLPARAQGVRTRVFASAIGASVP